MNQREQQLKQQIHQIGRRLHSEDREWCEMLLDPGRFFDQQPGADISDDRLDHYFIHSAWYQTDEALQMLRNIIDDIKLADGRDGTSPIDR